MISYQALVIFKEKKNYHSLALQQRKFKIEQS
jgi:hypothetical protein